MRHVGSGSQDRCGDEKIKASALNRNPVLQPGSCKGMELTTWVTALFWHVAKLFVFRILNICGKPSCFLYSFLWTLSNVRLCIEFEHTTIRGQNKSASSGLLSSYTIPSYPVAGDNSRYKRPLNKADNSPPFSLWFRTVGALPPRLTVPSLAHCLGTVTTLADISCTKTTYKAFDSAEPRNTSLHKISTRCKF